MKYSELLTRFLEYCDVQEITRARYHSNLKPFFLWIYREKILFENLKRSHIIMYKKYLTDSCNSIYTVRNYFNVVRLFFRWAEIEGVFDNIAAGIKQPRIRVFEITKTPLTEDQVKKLKSTADTNTLIGKRDLAIISIMVSLGLRVSELVTIDVSDIDYQNGIYTLRIKGKGQLKKTQQATVPDEIIGILTDYLEERNTISENDPMFISCSDQNRGNRISKWTVQNMVKGKLNKIGLTGKNYSTHSLRHTCATLALSNGYTLEQVQRHMRHSNPTTTQIYLRYLTEEQYKKNTIAHEIVRKTSTSEKNGHRAYINGSVTTATKSIKEIHWVAKSLSERNM